MVSSFVYRVLEIAPCFFYKKIRYLQYIYIIFTPTNKTNDMITYISVPNEKISEFEYSLEDFDFITNDKLIDIRERDFMTDFIFEDLSESEEEALEQLKNDIGIFRF